MKLRAGHLTYCTNIHAGESWGNHFESLRANFPLIKQLVSPHQRMGIGLRLSNTASVELQNSDRLAEFKSWLIESNAYVFTMNGFPYGDFHHAVVKDQVHAPDWTTKERVDYTLRMFDILAELLPEGIDGGISTSPLSYRYWHQSSEKLSRATSTATSNIICVLEKLIQFKTTHGTVMHLDIEPEPDGLLETGREFIDWYQNVLLPEAKNTLGGKLSMSADAIDEAVREHICLCYDVCHFAIGYEPHQEILNELASKDMRIGKIQISAALKSDLPVDVSSRKAISEAFEKFNEPTYLHQVVASTKYEELIRYRDLPQALDDIENPEVNEWRAHFHVPVFLEDLGILKSTQSDIIEVLRIQNAKSFTEHLEVETYTWEVLPAYLKVPIHQCIVRELNWVKDVLE
ncbi:metabolite traffic protein EboE [Daejeonella lutea]|uniref:Xylose isomerase-like TIM barrel n=1 Tax=Daejeonella lutea TaxID=572036 RepID=A0A1T5EE13_9SPHI|nr:metabolite traffic protein EboE [Daejeonella lutea]SKB82058.1 hypothetical protein SAMN05661099_2921 [Daejeonella lutea]